jgi:hypothetical protein
MDTKDTFLFVLRNSLWCCEDFRGFLFFLFSNPFLMPGVSTRILDSNQYYGATKRGGAERKWARCVQNRHLTINWLLTHLLDKNNGCVRGQNSLG